MLPFHRLLFGHMVIIKLYDHNMLTNEDEKLQTLFERGMIFIEYSRNKSCFGENYLAKTEIHHWILCIVGEE